MEECFPTSMTMTMANNGVHDQTLRNFMVDDIYDHWIESRRKDKSAKFQWQVEMEECIAFLNQSPVFGGTANQYVKWIEGATLEQIHAEIDNGYMVVMGTKKLGGLPGGHIVTVAGYDQTNLYLYDPFGDYRNYATIHDGKCIPVPAASPALCIVGPKKYRIMTIHSDKRIQC